MPANDMTYTVIKVGEGTGDPMPNATSMKAATSKAKVLGAKVMKENVEIRDMGWFSVVTDPTGAMLGLWENSQVRSDEKDPLGETQHL